MIKFNLLTKLSLTLVLTVASFSAFAQKDCNEAIKLLKEGNQRFCENCMVHQHQSMQTVKELTKGQHPFAVVISCSDSRVTPEIIFDQGLGDIFSIRTAGNVMADFEEGSIEYAVDHLDTKLIVVLGHTQCGAIKAFMDVKNSEGCCKKDDHHHSNLGHIQSIIDKLDSEEEEKEVFGHKDDDDMYNHAIEANVIHGVKQLKKCDPILAKMCDDHKIEIVGAIYDIESGEVKFLQ